MADLQILRKLFEEKLFNGPFPTAECAKAGIYEKAHGDLVIYLADIAGISSRGQNLADVDAPTKQRFRKLVGKGWWEMHPETTSSVTIHNTPRLYERISATEVARMIILNYLED